MKKTIVTILSTTAIFALFSIQTFANEFGEFSDVPSTSTYYKGITYLALNGIVNGNPDGTYKPENTLNRAEMIKIIAEGSAAMHPEGSAVFEAYVGENCFSDVKAGQWYTKYVCYGKAQGWVQGYSDGTFKPSQTVTFVEGLKIAFKGFDIPYSEDLAPWYRTPVEYAGSKNYIPFTIKGFGDGLKRGEMADLTTRIIMSGAGEGKLNEYLEARADIVVTYETIEAGLNLSLMQSETISTF